MELIRLLNRANALLIQGAYQGAENIIDSALEESRAIKSELSELATLRVRAVEMAAEIERLHDVIDEANAQQSPHFLKEYAVQATPITPEYFGVINDAHQSPENSAPDVLDITFYGNETLGEAINSANTSRRVTDSIHVADDNDVCDRFR